MRATLGGSGTVLSLNLRDKEIIEKRRYNHAVIQDKDFKRRVILRVVPTLIPDPHQQKFPWYDPPSGPFLEPDWYIDTIPTEAERFEKYPVVPIRFFRITITNLLWNKLTTEGYIGTRSIHDRIDIKYWEDGMR